MVFFRSEGLRKVLPQRKCQMLLFTMKYGKFEFIFGLLEKEAKHKINQLQNKGQFFTFVL